MRKHMLAASSYQATHVSSYMFTIVFSVDIWNNLELSIGSICFAIFSDELEKRNI